MLRIFCILLIASASCVSHDLNNLTAPEPEPYVCDPSISWQDDILPTMETSCATVGCHDGISRRDWTDYNEVKRYAASIKQRTVDRSMPFDGPPLSQDEINLIACWVDAGAPE
ncbi:MAG TPA: hypothetical protein VGD40_22970 [Chryseosolibacter sp.]